MALPTASDNQFPKVILEEVASDGSETVTPAADHRALFLGEDGVLHLKDSAAAVTDVGGGGGGLSAGTSNPGSPSAGDLFFRTDLGLIIYYDGTRWLSMQMFTLNHTAVLVTADTQALLPIPAARAIYLVSWDINAYVSTATTWVVTLSSVDTEFDLTTIDSQSTAAQSSAELNRYTKAIGAVIDATATHGANTLRSLHVVYDEQAGTSTFSGGVAVHYRLIVT